MTFPWKNIIDDVMASRFFWTDKYFINYMNSERFFDILSFVTLIFGYLHYRVVTFSSLRQPAMFQRTNLHFLKTFCTFIFVQYVPFVRIVNRNVRTKISNGTNNVGPVGNSENRTQSPYRHSNRPIRALTFLIGNRTRTIEYDTWFCFHVIGISKK